MEVVNGDLCQLYTLTQPGLLPRLAFVTMRQRNRGCGVDEHGDADLARIFGSLMMLLHVGEGSGLLQQGCMQAGGPACAEPILAPCISIQNGAWRFCNPVLDGGAPSYTDCNPCTIVKPASFSFSLCKSAS